MVIAMNKAAHGIADIANGLLGVILSTLKILVGVAVASYEFITKREVTAGTEQFLKGAIGEMGNAFKSFGKGASTLTEIPGALGRRGVLGDFGSNWSDLGEHSASTAAAPAITAAKRAAIDAAFGHPTPGTQVYSAHAATQQAVDRGVQSTNTGGHTSAFDHPIAGTAPAPGATVVTLTRTGNGYSGTVKQTTTTHFKIDAGKPRSAGPDARGKTN
jgi:hypothetical protein